VAVQHYFVMKTTPTLLRFCGQEAEASGDTFAELADWCRIHAEEEQPHHEWFAEDLKFAGYDKNVLDGLIPDDEVLSLMGSQFALIAACGPASILGFFHAMECHPSDPDAIIGLAERLRVPDEGLRTILFHTEEDLEHAVPIQGMVTRYGQDPATLAAMCRGAIAPFLKWTELYARLALA